MNYLLLCISVLGWGESLASDWQSRSRLPEPVIETLTSGLKVAWFENQNVSLIDGVVLIRSGSQDDALGKSGTAHLVSKLLDRGTSSKSALSFAYEVEKVGADRYVTLDDDSVTIGIHGLSDDADSLMGLLKEMVLDPAFTQEEFEKAKSLSLDQFRKLPDSLPNLATLGFQRWVSYDSIYGRGECGSLEEFSTIKREDVLAFHRSHFKPENAILLIAGKYDKEKLKKRIQSLFAGWVGSGARVAKSMTPFRDPRFAKTKLPAILIEKPGATQVQVRIGFTGPEFRSADHYPMLVVNSLFGEYFNSRLNSVVRDQLGLTYSIQSSLGFNKKIGTVMISASTRNEMSGQMVKKILDLVSQLKTDLPSELEVSTSKNYLLGSYPLGIASPSAAASKWLASQIFELGPDYLNEFIPMVSKVTLEEVRQAVKTHWTKTPLVILAGDPVALEAPLKKAGLWPVKRVKPGLLIQ